MFHAKRAGAAKMSARTRAESFAFRRRAPSASRVLLSVVASGILAPTAWVGAADADDCLRLQARVFPAGDSPSSLALGDLDGDGTIDWVTGGKTAISTLSLWLFRDGPLADPTRVDLPGGARVLDIDLGDVDGDDDLDVVVVQQTPCQYQVYLNDGRGQFTSLGPVAMTCSLVVRLLDTGNDGVLDLLTRTAGDTDTRRGVGDGTFEAPIPMVITGSPVEGVQCLVVKDVTGDGLEDAIVAVASPNGLSVLSSEGGTLHAGPFSSAPAAIVGIAAADLDNDGDNDIAAFENSTSESRYRVYLNNGIGTFVPQAPNSFASSSTTKLSFIELADVDGYAGPDVVIARQPSSVLIAPNNGKGLFASATVLKASVDPTAMRLADIDADGDCDVVVAYRNSDVVGCLRNHRGKGFDSPILSPLGNPSVRWSVHFDADGDGDQDLVTLFYVSSSNSGFFLNRNISNERGEVALAEPEIYPGTDGIGIDKHDMDMDGDVDLVICGWPSNTVSIRWNDGDGHFDATTTVATRERPDDVSVGDLNGDGLPDVIVSEWAHDRFSVILSVGVGSFAEPIEMLAGDGAYSTQLADLDADRDLDLALTNYNAETVSIWPNDGQGGFGTPTEYPVGESPSRPRIVDVNVDGRPDLVTAATVGGTIQVRLGDGTGAFGEATLITTSNDLATIEFEDDDFDGDPDLHVVFEKTGVSWRLANDGLGTFAFHSAASIGGEAQNGVLVDLDGDGRTELLAFLKSELALCERVAACANCLGDLDGDAVVGATDLAVVLGAWGGTGSADLNEDGVVGAGDLAVLLGAWGACS